MYCSRWKHQAHKRKLKESRRRLWVTKRLLTLRAVLPGVENCEAVGSGSEPPLIGCSLMALWHDLNTEVFFFSLNFLKNIYNLFFFFQFYTHKFTEKPHQLSVSVILAGGFTIYKEDIIQRKLSQRRSYQQGSLNLKDHCQVSFIKITNHLEALSYQLTMTCEINEQSLASAQCD